MTVRGVLAVLALTLAACSDPTVPARRVTGEPLRAAAAPTVPPEAEATASPVPDVIEVRYRVEVRVDGADDFPEMLAATMADPRGWVRAGFDVRPDRDGPYLVVLASGEEVDELCHPYDTGGMYSCQNGPVVALNIDRWNDAVPGWPASLEEYRLYLVNHEMGHLLGQRHVPCPGAGEPAPVMYQQSSNLRGCRPNGWPTEAEVSRAARHDRKLAPAYGE